MLRINEVIDELQTANHLLERLAAADTDPTDRHCPTANKT